MTNYQDSGRDKIALVTGGGTGVGKAISVALLGVGWTVVITGRRKDVLDEAARTLAAETKGTVNPIVSDVSDPKSVAALFEAVKAAYGRLDLLI
ncbi:SDR family NAD(P)-dependent oxidoreductase, partial [Escherichia coli]|nr:SDR family NAD(P)-dependent oxidoreductase [Escherichia coli]